MIVINFRFPAELKETIRECLDNELDNVEKKKNSKEWKMYSWLWKKSLGRWGGELKLDARYHFLSDCEAILVLESQMLEENTFKNPAMRFVLKGFENRVKGYEKDSEGKVKVNMKVVNECKKSHKEVVDEEGIKICSKCGILL